MFYSYALPFDTSGATVYSRAVSTATVQSPVGIARTTPDPVAVGAQTAQSVGYVPPSFPGPFVRDFSRTYPGGGARQGPFSRVYSNTFGEATGFGARSPLTVGKLLGFGGTMSPLMVSQASLPTGTPLRASHGMSSSISWTYLAAWFIQVTSGMAAALSFPRLNYAVVAARSANVARLRRSYAFWLRVNTPSNLFTDEFTNEWGVGPGGHIQRLLVTVNRALRGTDGQSAAVIRNLGKIIRRSITSVATMSRGPTQLARAISSAVQSRILRIAHLLAASSANAAQIIRRAPMRSNTTSAQSPRLSFGGNFFVRLIEVATTQSFGLLRQLAVLRGTVTSTPGAIIRSMLKSLTVASGNAGLTVKTVSLVRSAFTLGLTLATRTIGIPRQVISELLATLSRVAAHISPVIQAVSSSVANLTRSLAHGVDLALPTAQTMASSLAMVSTRLRSFITTQALSSDLVRGIGRSLSAVSETAASATKAITLSASVASQSIVSALTSAAHFVSLNILTGVSLGALRVARPILNAAEPLVSSVSTGFGRFAHISPSTFSTSAATIVRLTSKLIETVTGLFVEQIRGVVAITLRSELVQVVSYSQAARSVILVVTQFQRSRTVRWFHLFVPEWAYQQTALLPPGGGHAEPPAFGPIDPADQTVFAFDWSVRGDVNDPIASATISATPPGMTFFGPVFVSGSLVEVTVLPFTPPRLPMTYRLRCTAVFASGRRSSFTIPVPVRTL